MPSQGFRSSKQTFRPAQGMMSHGLYWATSRAISLLQHSVQLSMEVLFAGDTDMKPLALEVGPASQ